MRTIKFRVWDKSMAIPMQYFELKEITPFLIQKLDKVELMQYTGLKDKNGKEIYEGDIVNIDGANAEVCYYNGSPVVKDYFVGRPYEYLSTFDETDVEVIGNIYENPELLTPH